MAITETVDKLFEQLLYCDLRTEIGVDKAKKAIRLAIKEQDKKTRHACAEAMLKGPYVRIGGDAAIEIIAAQTRCINAQAL